ncbi:RcpC/CpaB family pilus assembly protein [Streptomyces griseus]|uniref:RcpC/CpaB family pilus assembly protein n=1 Tax=Streptomyces griseus TaxID=1911 RepID=UPI0036924912
MSTSTSVSPFPSRCPVPPPPPAPVPAPCGVGPFGPLRVRGGGADRLRRMMRRRRRAAVAGLALAGAALATTGLNGADGETGPPGATPGAGRPSVRLVSAPVRIADPETVRLLRPGDRVDVIAVGDTGGEARVVARGVRVAKVPHAAAGAGAHAADVSGPGAEAGALVLLSVQRSTAATLLGAGASGRLAVAVSDAT